MEHFPSFKFPFEPYAIQVDLMKNVYECLENRKLGIFESPTGTGKSLSLICGSLTWLTDHEHKRKLELEAELLNISKNEKPTAAQQILDSSQSNPVEPEWFTVAKYAHASTQKQSILKEELATISKNEERIRTIKDHAKQVKESLILDHGKQTIVHPDLKNKMPVLSSKKKPLPYSDNDEDSLVLSDSTEDSEVEEDIKEEMDIGTKIIYASRTHSQISQFVGEVRKSPFGDDIRVCTLASREQLCVNDEVRKLKNNKLMNERCLEMQKRKESLGTAKSSEGQFVKKTRKGPLKTTCCNFLDQQLIQNVRDVSLLEVHDVEGLFQLGKKLKGCPYYAARNAITASQLIVVPYTILLQQSTRKACGLNLSNNVVIIDEAHNLLESISSIHSCNLNGSQVIHAQWQLSEYISKYQTRLSAKNLLHIKQLQFFLACLLKTMGGSLAASKVNEEAKGVDVVKTEEEIVYRVIDFGVEAGFDHLNFHKLVDFCSDSKLPQKLAGFKPGTTVNPVGGLRSLLGAIKPAFVAPDLSTQQEATSEENSFSADESSPLLAVVDFMRNLGNPSEDGRILINRKIIASKSTLKYFVLNPASMFKDIVAESRAVIVAGGTMKPFFEFELLFTTAGAPADRVKIFSCGHVIPADHIFPIALTRGPSNKQLEFNWSQRSQLLDELSSLIYNVCQIVHGGVVCFLPSYDFENEVVEFFKTKGYISKIESKKKLFREPRKAIEVDRTLMEYSRAIRMSSNGSVGQKGALLLCVVGGKLSEGINFSDELARCVLVVGLPYPNRHSAELKEKCDYLDGTQKHMQALGETRLPSQLYYESLCFKAVNQSIGRAIRHKNDYAVILLADYRYARPSSKGALPGWISDQLAIYDKFGPSLAAIRKVVN